MTHENSFYGPLADPAADAGHPEHPPRVGFFTDTSVCIGCKACEVACKEWNAVPEDGLNLLGMSFDNTGMLGADSWRHVAFIEQDRPLGAHDAGLAGLPTGPGVSEAAAEVVAEALREAPRGGGDLGTAPVDLGFPLPAARRGSGERAPHRLPLADGVRRVQALHARRLPGRLPDRGAVPHRVRHGRRAAGHLQRLRLLRVRLPLRGDRPAARRRAGQQMHAVLRPAARRPGAGLRQGLPDQIHPVRSAGRAAGTRGPRLDQLHDAGVTEARLYGHDPDDGVGGDGAFFLLLDEPEVYGLPPDPVVPTRDLASTWKYAGLAASALVTAAVSVFLGQARPMTDDDGSLREARSGTGAAGTNHDLPPGTGGRREPGAARRAAREVPVLLRPAGTETAGVGVEDPGLPFHRRPVGRRGPARGGRRPNRAPGAAAGGPARRASRPCWPACTC